MKHLEIFPTVITTKQRKVTNSEKLAWFDIIMNNLDEHGTTHDFLGFQTFHHNESVRYVYEDIAATVKAHLVSLGVDTSTMDINITKSFANICYGATTPEHDHSENHYSFAYYPNMPEDVRQTLDLYRLRSNPNEPVWDFIRDNGTPSAAAESIHRLHVREGTIVVFPSSLVHGTSYVNPFKQHMSGTFLEPIPYKEALFDFRVCISGDCLLTRKDNKAYKRMIMPVDSWRKFNE